jgi:hypothetical protein
MTGCDRLVPAIGSNSSVTLVTHLPADHAAEQALKATFEREVVMVFPEPAFEVEVAQSSRLGRLRQARNLVLMADLSRSDGFTAEIERLVGDDLFAAMRDGRRYHVFYSNVWALGQTTLVLAGPNGEALADAIEQSADRLYETLERRVIQRTEEIIFVTGEQEEFSRYLSSAFGWTMRIPKGYRVSEDAESRVVRCYMPEGGVRLVFVHWKDGVSRVPGTEACIDIRGRIVWQYDEDTIVEGRTRSSRVDFLGGRALKLEGVWQNDRHTKGGPFRTYCFVKDDRFYMLDMLVFDPEGSKINLMRQLEAIALTFEHTAE